MVIKQKLNKNREVKL